MSIFLPKCHCFLLLMFTLFSSPFLDFDFPHGGELLLFYHFPPPKIKSKSILSGLQRIMWMELRYARPQTRRHGESPVGDWRRRFHGRLRGIASTAVKSPSPPSGFGIRRQRRRYADRRNRGDLPRVDLMNVECILFPFSIALTGGLFEVVCLEFEVQRQKHARRLACAELPAPALSRADAFRLPGCIAFVIFVFFPLKVLRPQAPNTLHYFAFLSRWCGEF